MFFFRTDRGLSFVDRPGAGSTTANGVVSTPGGPQLQYSPGRIDPTNSAWNTSRKPLAAEFMYGGDHLFVIANHFNSKGGDQPLFGHPQPPVRSSEVQRHQQAQIENDFVDQILALDPSANVIALGDLNDFAFSDTLSILEGGVLTDLGDTLPPNEQYSFMFDGNGQDLDHVLVSNAMLGHTDTYDIVHMNIEFAASAADHDPAVGFFTMSSPWRARSRAPRRRRRSPARRGRTTSAPAAVTIRSTAWGATTSSTAGRAPTRSTAARAATGCSGTRARTT